jgi:arylsulfatase A-like enzyme
MGDNGFLFGEHGLIDKRNAYEESMRVPLLVSAPGRYAGGQAVNEMVANIDIAPTLLALAGAAPPDHYDGMSFAHLPKPAAADAAAAETGADAPPWRDSLTYEYYWEFNYPQTPTVFALRTDRYKYIQYHGVWDTEELYDLEKDPGESENLIEHPDLLGVKVGMRERLYTALADSQGNHTIPYSMKFNQGAVFRHAERSPAAEFPEKWLRKGGAPDRWEHILPDGPEKAAQLKAIDQALKDR